MTDVLVKKKTLTNQSSLKIKENQKVNQRGDSRIGLEISKRHDIFYGIVNNFRNPIIGCVVKATPFIAGLPKLRLGFKKLKFQLYFLRTLPYIGVNFWNVIHLT